MEVFWPGLTDIKTDVSLSLKATSSQLYEPVSCPLCPWVAGTNLRLQTKEHDKQSFPYLAELYFCSEPSCHLDGGQVILAKTTSQFLSCGAEAGEAEHEADSVPGDLPCCPPPRSLDISGVHGPHMASLWASLSLSRSSCLCTSPTQHSCTYQTHAARSTPLQAVENIRGHTEAFRCSWELCEDASGPPAWAHPLDAFHFYSSTRCGTRRPRPLPAPHLPQRPRPFRAWTPQT